MKKQRISFFTAVLSFQVFLILYGLLSSRESQKVTEVPVIQYKETYVKPKDFYDDSTLTEEKKFYYDHLYNTTSQ